MRASKTKHHDKPKLVRTRQEVPWAEFEPFANRIKNTLKLNQGQLQERMGFSTSVFTDWKNKGKAPVFAMYILEGILLKAEAEHQKAMGEAKETYNTGIVFTTDQLEALVYALRTAQSEQLKHIRTGLMRELLKRIEE